MTKVKVSRGRGLSVPVSSVRNDRVSPLCSHSVLLLELELELGSQQP